MAMTALGVLSTVTHLRTFASQRVLLRRERASGLSVSAFFAAQNVIDLAWVFLSPALFLGIYYTLTLPQLPFWQYYLAAVCVCWWCSGMAYLVSAVVPGPSVLMVGVFIALIMGAFVQGLSPTIASVRGGALEVLLGLSYNRWAMEIVATREVGGRTNAHARTHARTRQ
jgi:hypothetical protein